MYPIYINNRDLLTWTRDMADRCAQLDGAGEVVIIDNNSTYPPLLDWYANCPYRVIRLGRNVGPRGLWSTNEPLDTYFIGADNDMGLEDLPRDALHLFREILDRNPTAIKTGPSFITDDVPDHYPHKRAVIEVERNLCRPHDDPWCYTGEIDTLFAMYRPRAGWGGYGPAVRTKPPYQVRHRAWYVDETDEEYTYYLKHAGIRQALHWATLEYDRRAYPKEVLNDT